MISGINEWDIIFVGEEGVFECEFFWFCDKSTWSELDWKLKIYGGELKETNIFDWIYQLDRIFKFKAHLNEEN